MNKEYRPLPEYSLKDVLANVQERLNIYKQFTPEEQKECDDFNAKVMRTVGIENILKLGEPPFHRIRKKYGL